VRVLQFSGMLAAEDHKVCPFIHYLIRSQPTSYSQSQKLQLSHWMGLVEEFFLASATLKLTLWKDNQKVEAKVFGLS
jgi:hypothetical protein